MSGPKSERGLGVGLNSAAEANMKAYFAREEAARKSQPGDSAPSPSGKPPSNRREKEVGTTYQPPISKKVAVDFDEEPTTTGEATTTGEETGDEETRTDINATEEARRLMELGDAKLPPDKPKHKPPAGYTSDDKVALTRGRLKRD